MTTINLAIMLSKWAVRRICQIETSRNGENLILFIHGLGGSAAGTWGEMLRVLASDDELSRFAFDCYSYPTSLVRLPFNDRRSGVREISNGLLTYLKAHHADKKSILIVGHSLGGIIARQFLLEIEGSSEFSRIKGLMLYAVPNTGAAIASLGQFVSFNHRHLLQLCKNSDLLDGLNNDWVKREIEKKIRTIYVVGSGDQVVQRESAACFIGADIRTVMGPGHREIVKPDERTDTRFKILKDFLFEVVPYQCKKKLALTGTSKADPLFDIYSRDVEPYYVKRKADQILREASVGAHVWVSGDSGVGKTAALKRLADISEWNLQQISLGSFQNATALPLLRAVCNELYERGGMSTELVPVNTDLQGILAHLKKIYGIFADCQALAIFVEEIPLPPGPQYAEFLDSIYHVTLEANVHSRQPRVIWLFSSIYMPEPDISTQPMKFRERVQFIHFLPWEKKDLAQLIAYVCSVKKLKLTKDARRTIAENANGNPRFVKVLLREMRNELGMQAPLDEIITSVQSRLAINV